MSRTEFIIRVALFDLIMVGALVAGFFMVPMKFLYGIIYWCALLVLGVFNYLLIRNE
jgi:hypothetical protein